MTRTDALINRTPPPPPRTLEKCGGYIENDWDYLTKLPPCGGITTVKQDHCCLIDK